MSRAIPSASWLTGHMEATKGVFTMIGPVCWNGGDGGGGGDGVPGQPWTPPPPPPPDGEMPEGDGKHRK